MRTVCLARERDLHTKANLRPPAAHDHSPASETSPGETTWNLSEQELPQPDDPTTDGWQSEVFSRSAEQQLRLLGEFIVARPATTGQEIAKLLDDGFSSDRLLPSNLQVVHDDPTFSVKRSPQSESATATRSVGHSAEGRNALDRLRAAVEPLQQSMSGHDLLRFKFKLFRVEIKNQQTTTRQYFSLTGRNSQGAREQNATWQIVWTHPSPRQPPRIRSIDVVEFEQVSTKIGGGLLLTDCTDSVLDCNVSYKTALLPGIQYWRDRLEQQLGVYHFGHHGLAIGDVNGDERDDLYVCQTGGLPNHLYLQQPDGTLRDVSSEAHVDYLDNTRSALFVDLDNDDDQDLILALANGLICLENVSSSRGTQFELRARFPSIRQAFSLSAADYDQDGQLDLYVCVYYGKQDVVSELPLPLPYFDAKNGGGNYLIRNLGNWKFENVTGPAGLDNDNSRFSLAAAWEDYDNDGDVDLMVINDFGPNQLFQNNHGRFSDVAAQVGLLDGAFGMSATFADFDHNGRMDLYVSNMFSAAGNRVTFQPQFMTALPDADKARFQYLARGNSLFTNLGADRFEDVSVSHGVTMGRWSWGSLFGDINNDGWDDLLVANGYLTGESADDL